jgi:hypothetical protein
MGIIYASMGGDDPLKREQGPLLKGDEGCQKTQVDKCSLLHNFTFNFPETDIMAY